MPYDPTRPDLITPGKFNDFDVLYFDGVSAVAIGQYDGANHRSIGMRWMEAEGPQGYPVTFGHPTWMVVPDQLAVCMLEGILREGTNLQALQTFDHDGIQVACTELRTRLAENGDAEAEQG